MFPPRLQLGEGGRHAVRHDAHEVVQERVAPAEQPVVPDGPAQDPAQHVAPLLVRGEDAVGEQEGHGPRVIRQHAEGDAVLPVFGRPRVLEPEPLLRRFDDREEEVRVVVRSHALKQRRDPLESGARVDRGRGERRVRAVRRAVELHEHEVPELDDLVRLARRLELRVGDAVVALRPQVVVQFRAGAARTRVAHLPEVVLVPHAPDARLRDRGAFQPEVEGVVVVVVDRGPQAAGLQAEVSGHPLPGEVDRVALEVVAEGKVPEHLEEGVVARGPPHFLEVVVLAADAEAFLGGDGARGARALRLSREDALELHHPGVREHEGRVIRGDERAAGPMLVPLPLEVGDETPPEFVRLHRVSSACQLTSIHARMRPASNPRRAR